MKISVLESFRSVALSTLACLLGAVPSLGAGSRIVAWGQATAPTNGTDVVAITGGFTQNIAVHADGTATVAMQFWQKPLGLTNLAAAAVSASSFNMLALNADGTVAASGYLFGNPIRVIEGLTNVVAIAAGQFHSVALQADGTVVAWGWPWPDRESVPAGITNAIAIAAGAFHTLVLKSDGTVAVGGTNNFGQLDVPPGLTNVVAVLAGQLHSLALKADGTVVAWGGNYATQTNVPSDLSNVVAIAAGYAHSLALKADGTVVAWGALAGGQSTVPLGLSNVIAIAAGGASVAIVGEGAPLLATNIPAHAVPPGADAFLQIPFSGAPPLAFQWRLNSAPLPGATNASLLLRDVQLPQDGAYSLQVSNSFGTAISGDLWVNVIRLRLAAQPQAQTIFAGGEVKLSVAAEGIGPFSYQWHFNGIDLPGATNNPLVLNNVQLDQTGGYSVTVSNAYGTVTTAAANLGIVPVLIKTQPQSQRVIVGQPVAFSVEADGTGSLDYQWRFNGAAMSGETKSSLALPRVRLNQNGAYSVTVSSAYGTVASQPAQLTVDQVVSWWVDTPFAVTNVSAVSAGGIHALGLRTDGTVLAWGLNYYGQTNVPVGLNQVTAIAAGAAHSLALRSDGTVVAWGDNTHGQANVPFGLTNVVAVAAGGRPDPPIDLYEWFPCPSSIVPSGYSLALKTDGTLAVWGDSFDASSSVAHGLSDAIAIAAGADHSLALRANGTVIAWGSNASGQTNVPVGLSNVVAVAAGYDHNLALTAKGTVIAWGLNSSRQTEVPAGLTNVVAIAAGYNHSLALRADGSVAAWGAVPDTAGVTRVPSHLKGVEDIAAGYSYSLALAGEGPPVLTSRLIDRTILPGESTPFRITATGTWPLSYQWRFNGADILGATNAWLWLDHAQPADAGAYSVIVSNALGIKTTSAARLQVVPVVLLTQRQDQTVRVHNNATFAPALRVASPSQYQWHFNGADIPDATNATLILMNVQMGQSGAYTLTVSNEIGTLTSSNAILVVEPLHIAIPPQAQTAFAGGQAIFSVTTEGEGPFGYQWQLNGADLPGAANASLTITNVQLAQSGLYTVTVSNAFGSITSPAARLEFLGQWRLRDATQAYGITFGNGLFVAVGEKGTILTSPNGIQWTSRPVATSAKLTSVAYGNPIYTAVGESGTIVTSADAVNWTVRNSGGSDLTGVAYGDGVFVVVGLYGVILSSSDGIKWGFTRLPWWWGPNYVGVAFGAHTFVVAGLPLPILATAQARQRLLPTAWIDRNAIDCVTVSRIVQTPMDDYQDRLCSITYGNGVFVAVGRTGVVLTSPDAENWTRQIVAAGNPVPWPPVPTSSVAFANGTFVAMGSKGLFTSPDGRRWAGQSWPDSVFGLAYGNHTFIALTGAGIFQAGSPPPAIDPSNLKLISSGPFQFNVSSAPEFGLGIEVSTNLITWTRLSSSTNAESSTLQEDKDASQHTRRFYRAVTLP